MKARSLQGGSRENRDWRDACGTDEIASIETRYASKNKIANARISTPMACGRVIKLKEGTCAQTSQDVKPENRQAERKTASW
jgi:hypothetical protein